MSEYLELNHMEIVPNEELSLNSYYLIHHCVLKPDSSTTKLRVVFNGSIRHPNQKSLNECLMTGPKLQPDICRILINFRLHPYVICCDIKQMYRMIWVDPAHRDFQRILFRFSPNDKVQDYRLNTVTYGLRPSPYQALRVLRKLAEDEKIKYPLASQLILNNSYIDDFLFSAPSLEQAQLLRNELILLLETAGFLLRKFSSNSTVLLNDLPESHVSMSPLTIAQDFQHSFVKILGLQWNPTNDFFTFQIHPCKDNSCSKRLMLSELARVYDPLGFITPVTFLLKHLIQKLWISKLDWDDTPSNEIVRLWTQYKNELSLLSQLKIPRILMSHEYSSIELHGFCDASEKGYACVLYFRIFRSHFISTQFIISKSKIAPLNKISIPRLELCAAILLTKLIK